VATTDAGALNAGAYGDLDSRTRIRVSAARRFRFPTIRQLFDEAAGNPTLKPERATTYEIGVARELPGRSRVTVALFQTDVRDYIERPDQSQPFANYDVYRFEGLELSAETAALRGLFARAGYTLLNTEDRSPGATRTDLQYRPRHRATVEGRYTLRGFSASASMLHVADQRYYTRREPFEQATLPDYTLLGLRMGQRLPGRGVEAFLGIDNLFNVAYEEEYGSPQATRTWYSGLAVRW
jgi:outer membrane receptor protein involved in Fe transport